MKTNFIALLILGFITSSLTVNNASAAKYYISETGNDVNDGLSPSTAWLSLSKVHSYHFLPGDSVLFKRGDAWRGQLSNNYDGSADGGYITYSAYGTGPKPKILGSNNLSAPESWVNSSGNIWKSTGMTVSKDCANLVFNNETTWGVKKSSLAACTSIGNFYFNPSEHKIYLYSTINPGSYYSHLEAGGVYSENIIEFINAYYIIFDNLDARYSGNNGIFLNSCDHIIIQNCDFSWIGGWYYPEEGTSTRMGNAIQMWRQNSNIIIRYNRINQAYDAGISPQGGSASYTQQNIYMYYNVISNCYYSFEWSARTPKTLININFVNNTCINAGSQWSENQRPARGDEEHIRCVAQTQGTVSDCHIENNIFYGSIKRVAQLDVTSGLTDDYNLYYNDVAMGTAKGHSYSTLAQWQSGTGYDTHSLWADPSLVSPSYFSIKSGSPAIGAGTDVGLSPDYLGHAVNNPPSIGAYENAVTGNNTPSIQDQVFQINNNSPKGTIIGTIHASDPDTGQSLTYSIVSGNTDSAFAINAATGELFVSNRAALTSDYSLIVKVQDNGIGVLSNQATLTVNVVITATKINETNKEINVYPNPVSDELITEIEGNMDTKDFEILNLVGQIVFNGSVSEKTTVQTAYPPQQLRIPR